MIEIQGAVSTVKASFDVLKGALAARDDAKIRDAVIALQDKLFEVTSNALLVQQQLMAAHLALAEAKREKHDLERKLEERIKYRLEELRPGAFAYGSQPDPEGDNPSKHYLCQPCYDLGKKIVLRASANYGAYHCPEESKHTISSGEGWRRTFNPSGL